MTMTRELPAVVLAWRLIRISGELNRLAEQLAADVALAHDDYISKQHAAEWARILAEEASAAVVHGRVDSLSLQDVYAWLDAYNREIVPFDIEHVAALQTRRSELTRYGAHRRDDVLREVCPIAYDPCPFSDRCDSAPSVRIPFTVEHVRCHRAVAIKTGEPVCASEDAAQQRLNRNLRILGLRSREAPPEIVEGGS
ncbi:MAG: hypothetical protein AB7Q01_16470 [Gammaproteobacteria bacterium]